jgi:hypothetical protein
MTTERALDAWRTDGIISADQHAVLSALARKARVSIALELHALLYLGVLAFAAGAAWTIRDHFAALGDAAILATLTIGFAGGLFYCFSRTPPFSFERVESPTFAFDYVLYLSCLAFAAALGYVEFRFHVLQASWDRYLLASAVLYFALAYRFDNRFVLSLALSTLAGWFGVRLSAWDLLPSTLRVLAIVYGGVVAALGVGLQQRGIKRHFLDAYLHVAANAVLLALASGVATTRHEPLWFVALLAVAVAAVVLGIRFAEFAFVVYGVVYGYVGLSSEVMKSLPGDTAVFTYFVVSAVAVVGGLVAVARRFGREG